MIFLPGSRTLRGGDDDGNEGGRQRENWFGGSYTLVRRKREVTGFQWLGEGGK